MKAEMLLFHQNAIQQQFLMKPFANGSVMTPATNYPSGTGCG